MAHEDFQITPLKKYTVGDASLHKQCETTKTETVTSSDTYQQYTASLSNDDVSACQSVMDLLDDNIFNKLKPCGNFERQANSLQGVNVVAETMMTEEPFPGKASRSVDNYSVHAGQR